MMRPLRCLKLLHVLVIKRSSRPSINPFLAIGHIAGKHCIYVMCENICGYVLPWNFKTITLLCKCFSLILLVPEHRSGFHVWGSLEKNEKAEIENENTFLVQPS